MIKKIYNLLIFLTGFSLLWQTKIIIRPAEINYWEISLFLPMLFLCLFIGVFYKHLLTYFKNKNYLKGSIISLVVLELFIIISIFFSLDFILSLYRYLVFVLAVLFYLIVKNFNDYQKKLIIYGVFLAGFFQALIANLQFIYQRSLESKYLGLALQEASVLGTAVVETSFARWLRAYGAFDHPNVLGSVMAIICLFSAWFLIKNNSKKIEEKIFLWLVYLSSLAALFFSFSRTAWIVFVFLMLCLSLFFIINKIFTKRLLLLVFSSIFLILPLFFIYQDLVITRLTASGRVEQISISERRSELEKFKFENNKQVLFGQGIGASTLWQYQRKSETKDFWQYQPIHNTYLLLILEIGIFGFLAFLAFLFFSTKELINKKGDKLFLGLLTITFFIFIFFFDHWVFSLPFGLLFFFFFLAIIE